LILDEWDGGKKKKDKEILGTLLRTSQLPVDRGGEKRTVSFTMPRHRKRRKKTTIGTVTQPSSSRLEKGEEGKENAGLPFPLYPGREGAGPSVVRGEKKKKKGKKRQGAKSLFQSACSREKKKNENSREEWGEEGKRILSQDLQT